MKLIGIDYGSKNIGVSISDDGGTMAFPKTVFSNNEKALPLIIEMIENESVELVVLGESTNFRGEENVIMKDIHRFKKNLESRISIPIHFEPEILSTQEAKRGQEDIKKVDASAATIVLQSYIDRYKNKHE
jgi:putative holliday junction resolvase